MAHLQRQAEQLRLARLLSTPVETLDFLSTLDPGELQSLREICGEFLQRQHRPLFQRIARASKLLPTALAARIAERTLGALLCARVAGEISLPLSAALCRHHSPAFMASITVHMEPERVAAVAAALPPDLVGKVACELLSRREFITLADLVAEMAPDLVAAALQDLPAPACGEGLLNVLLFVRDAAQLQVILERAAPAQLAAMLQASADAGLDLWPEALALLARLPPLWQRHLLRLAMDSGPELLQGMIAGTVRHGLWQPAASLVEMMTEDEQRQLMQLTPWQDEELLRALLQARLNAGASLSRLRALVALMPGRLRSRAEALVAELAGNDSA